MPTQWILKRQRIVLWEARVHRAACSLFLKSSTPIVLFLKAHPLFSVWPLQTLRVDIHLTDLSERSYWRDSWNWRRSLIVLFRKKQLYNRDGKSVGWGQSRVWPCLSKSETIITKPIKRICFTRMFFDGECFLSRTFVSIHGSLSVRGGEACFWPSLSAIENPQKLICFAWMFFYGERFIWITFISISLSQISPPYVEEKLVIDKNRKAHLVYMDQLLSNCYRSTQTTLRMWRRSSL